MSTRIGTKADGTKCAGASNDARGLRVFDGSRAHPSRFTATITPDPSVTLYLRSLGLFCFARPASLSDDAPRASVPTCHNSSRLRYPGGNAWASIGTWRLPAQVDYSDTLLPEVRNAPPAPEPEPITVEHLPLPPAAPSGAAGSCDATANPRATGCISDPGQPGGFIDAHDVVANVTFAGAPAAPDPASVYTARS